MKNFLKNWFPEIYNKSRAIYLGSNLNLIIEVKKEEQLPMPAGFILDLDYCNGNPLKRIPYRFSFEKFSSEMVEDFRKIIGGWWRSDASVLLEEDGRAPSFSEYARDSGIVIYKL